MKYESEIIINLPVDRVIELFDSTENLKEWQPGLQSFEHISGTPGQPGAKSRLTYKMGKREVEMLETVTVTNLPDEFTGTYDADGVHNIVRNRFIPIDANTTRYVTEQEFQMKGLMKILGWIMPGSFKKQTREYLENFKKFAESQEP